MTLPLFTLINLKFSIISNQKAVCCNKTQKIFKKLNLTRNSILKIYFFRRRSMRNNYLLAVGRDYNHTSNKNFSTDLLIKLYMLNLRKIKPPLLVEKRKITYVIVWKFLL